MGILDIVDIVVTALQVIQEMIIVVFVLEPQPQQLQLHPQQVQVQQLQQQPQQLYQENQYVSLKHGLKDHNYLQ